MADYVTHLSGLSLGIDPARADKTPKGRTSGPYLSVGTQYMAGIQRISSGTVALGAIAHLAAQGSSISTWAANGPLAASDAIFFNPTAESGVSGGFFCIDYSFISQANVVGIRYSNYSGTAMTQAETKLRWTAISY